MTTSPVNPANISKPFMPRRCESLYPAKALKNKIMIGKMKKIKNPLIRVFLSSPNKTVSPFLAPRVFFTFITIPAPPFPHTPACALPHSLHDLLLFVMTVAKFPSVLSTVPVSSSFFCISYTHYYYGEINFIFL